MKYSKMSCEKMKNQTECFYFNLLKNKIVHVTLGFKK